MRKAYLTSILLAISIIALSQTQKQISLIQKFEKASNDSVFISKNSSKKIYNYPISNKIYNKEFNEVDSILFNGDYKKVIGPFETDSFFVWFKIQKIDSSIRMRVGNIYISDKEISEDSANSKADLILFKAKAGDDFNKLCQLYSDDENSQYDCDLGWFFEGSMVKPFEIEVKNHIMGDIFKVKTEFGWHIVKVLNNPIKERLWVYAAPIYLLK